MDSRKNFQINYQILLQEVHEFKREMWERSRFCTCGADTIYRCECDPEQKRRFIQRRKRKVNEKFSGRIEDILNRDTPTLD